MGLDAVDPLFKTIIFATVGLSLYEKTSAGTLCSDVKYEITSESECKQAGELLGLQWKQSWDGPNDFPACLKALDGRDKVYFNLSPNPGRTNVQETYLAICMTKGNNNHI